jgi:nucleoside-diphosphate-sugar epimerase
MKILVTGSSGFIGKNLKEALQKQFSDANIVAIKRGGTLSAGEHAVDYRYAQTLLDCEACKDVDYAFHLAGITKEVSFENFYQANVVPTANLLDALKQKSLGLKRFVLLSSHAAAGPSRDRTHYKTESEEENPIDYYGESKWMAEQVVKSYCDVLPCTILRPGSVYGPEDLDFLNIFKMAKSGINIYPGNRRKYFSPIYIDDLIDGIFRASFSDSAIARTYFVCNDEPITWQQMHKTIFSIVGKEPLNISIPFPFVKGLSYLVRRTYESYLGDKLL